MYLLTEWSSESQLMHYLNSHSTNILINKPLKESFWNYMGNCNSPTHDGLKMGNLMSCMQKNLLCQEIQRNFHMWNEYFLLFVSQSFLFSSCYLQLWLSKKLKQYFMFLRFHSRISSGYCNFYNLQK